MRKLTLATLLLIVINALLPAYAQKHPNLDARSVVLYAGYPIHVPEEKRRVKDLPYDHNLGFTDPFDFYVIQLITPPLLF